MKYKDKYKFLISITIYLSQLFVLHVKERMKFMKSINILHLIK